MSSTVAKSFTATGVGTAISVKHNHSLSYAVSGTFVGTVLIESSQNAGASWESIGVSATAAASGSYLAKHSDQGQKLYRFRCSAFTSGTIVTSIANQADVVAQFQNEDGAVIFQIKEDSVNGIVRTSQTLVIPATGLAKVGTTAGWVVAPTNNLSLVTLPASQSASTFIMPVVGLKVGQTITSFNLVGQIESAGGTVTLDADLRKHTAAAADVSDASVGAITQLSVTADTIISSSNSQKASLSQLVAADESYYVLITATTAGATDIGIQALQVQVTEA